MVIVKVPIALVPDSPGVTNVLAPAVRLGDHILLAIRPEHVVFASEGVAGEIMAATFLGERSHYHVRIAGRSEPIAVSGGAPPSGPVHLAFPPERLMGLPTGD